MLYCKVTAAVKFTQQDPHVGETRPGDLAGALHEVSNALTAVLGWLQRARGQMQPGTAERDATDVAYTHARLAYSVARQAIGAPIADEEEVRSGVTLAQEALRGVEQSAARKGIGLQFVGEDQDTLLNNATSVHQILLNLLLNAVAFSPERAEVRLAVKNLGQFLSFVVTDEGPGIEPERAATLFTEATSTRPGGAGLGLRYCKGLASQKGGDLRLLQHTGLGARFELLWPCGEAPSTTLQKSPRVPQLAGMKVVVLEDDEAITSLLELGLSANGLQLTFVRTIEEFQEFFARGLSADAALVDLSPVSPKPAEALLIADSHCGETPMVVMSGRTVDSIPGVHVAGWLRKPFELSEVLDVLARVAAKRAAKA
ncbi:MAG TPA: ATP-binding protein [Polyangiaceae bacterium]|nr:ATP-binding protein [Polyangiaceae bacterium]